MPAIILILFLFLLTGGSPPGGYGTPRKAGAEGLEPWVLTVTGINCVTAVASPIDCVNALAVDKYVTYTVTNNKGLTTTRTRTFPAKMTERALELSLAHELHQRKYAPPPEKTVTPGFTITK